MTLTYLIWLYLALGCVYTAIQVVEILRETHDRFLFPHWPLTLRSIDWISVLLIAVVMLATWPLHALLCAGKK